MHHNLDANFSWAYMITTYINQKVFIYIFHKSLPTTKKIVEETYLCQYFSTWYQKFTSDLSMACIITGLTEVHYFVGGFLFIFVQDSNWWENDNDTTGFRMEQKAYREHSFLWWLSVRRRKSRKRSQQNILESSVEGSKENLFSVRQLMIRCIISLLLQQ